MGISENPNGEASSDSRIGYYDLNAGAYAEQTFGLDRRAAAGRFAGLLPEGARVLDVGTGSGRDALALAALGMRVFAMDASPAMAREAAARTGMEVRVGRAEDIGACFPGEAFDGVWMSAALLHLGPACVRMAWASVGSALAADGVAYASLKKGEGMEFDRLGRFFSYWTRESISETLPESLSVEGCWEEPDSSRLDTNWLNMILRKRAWA